MDHAVQWWWKKSSTSWTSWYGKYAIVCRVSFMSGRISSINSMSIGIKRLSHIFLKNCFELGQFYLGISWTTSYKKLMFLNLIIFPSKMKLGHHLMTRYNKEWTCWMILKPATRRNSCGLHLPPHHFANCHGGQPGSVTLSIHPLHPSHWQMSRLLAQATTHLRPRVVLGGYLDLILFLSKF